MVNLDRLACRLRIFTASTRSGYHHTFDQCKTIVKHLLASCEQAFQSHPEKFKAPRKNAQNLVVMRGFGAKFTMTQGDLALTAVTA